VDKLGEGSACEADKSFLKIIKEVNANSEDLGNYTEKQRAAVIERLTVFRRLVDENASMIAIFTRNEKCRLK
jgi:hypothetical protein